MSELSCTMADVDVCERSTIDANRIPAACKIGEPSCGTHLVLQRPCSTGPGFGAPDRAAAA